MVSAILHIRLPCLALNVGKPEALNSALPFAPIPRASYTGTSGQRPPDSQCALPTWIVSPESVATCFSAQPWTLASPWRSSKPSLAPSASTPSWRPIASSVPAWPPPRSMSSSTAAPTSPLNGQPNNDQPNARPRPRPALDPLHQSPTRTRTHTLTRTRTSPRSRRTPTPSRPRRNPPDHRPRSHQRRRPGLCAQSFLAPRPSRGQDSQPPARVHPLSRGRLRRRHRRHHLRCRRRRSPRHRPLVLLRPQHRQRHRPMRPRNPARPCARHSRASSWRAHLFLRHSKGAAHPHRRGHPARPRGPLRAASPDDSRRHRLRCRSARLPRLRQRRPPHPGPSTGGRSGVFCRVSGCEACTSLRAPASSVYIRPQLCGVFFAANHGE